MLKKLTLFSLILFISIDNCQSAKDFTIGIIPDTQCLSETYADYPNTIGYETMKKISQFFIDSLKSLNIAFVASVGDMVENTVGEGDFTAEWKRVKYMYDMLGNAGIPYSPCQGNHDPTSWINKTFPVDSMSKKPTWGGSYNGGIENAYYLFSAGGMDFILLATQFGNNDAVNTWANSIYSKYYKRRAILISHTGVSQVKSPNNSYLVDNIIRKHDNIFLANQGHLCENNGNEYWKSTSIGGKTQHLIRTDYQCRKDGGSEGSDDGYGGASLRYYTFKPAKDSVYAYTYNVLTKTYDTTANDQFSFAYDMTNLPYDSSHIVASVTLSPTSLTKIIGSTAQITATVLPKTAEYKAITWTSDNTSVATVSSSGLVKAIAIGTANITVTTIDDGKTASSFITVIADTVRTAINNFKHNPSKLSLNIFPNPLNQDILTMKLDGYEESGNIEAIITNLQGQMVFQKQFQFNKTLEINTSGILKSSIYFVSVKSEKSVCITKLIVK